MLLVACGAACSISAPAAALEPGVTRDPNSPAGKEYSLLLPVQRGQAGGQRPPQSQPPLFGVGIAPPGVGGQGAISQSRAAQQGGAGLAPARSQSQALTRRQSRALTRRQAEAPNPRHNHTPSAGPDPSKSLASLARPSSATLPVALLAAAVLVGGLALGAALAAARRR